jgi:group II intron reverse transcriptase/maturase
MEPIERQFTTETKLKRIAFLSSQNSSKVFHQLMHHYNLESLEACYRKLDGKKALGADGISKAEYGKHLKANLEELLERMKRMGYRPGAVRKVWIPKEGKPGATRPLGISSFEDKLVQKMTQEILESIYEPLFLNNSYGFRPNRGCHDVIEELHQHLHRTELETVIDVDLENFFGTIDHKIMEEILREKIADKTFMRYIIRMFKAGVLTNGELTVDEEGVPQGSICSPILSNIFAHYVIDKWFEETVKPNCQGRVEMFRYADDMVVCCRSQIDAERIKKALAKRLTKYNLKMNEDKTKLVSFSKSKYGQGIKQETFDFLGFTFYLGRSRKGKVISKLKTSRKRFTSKLKQIKVWAKTVKNEYPLKNIWRMICAKVKGHIEYFGVSFNSDSIARFVYQVRMIMFKWLNRRSQRRSFTWESYEEYTKRYPLPAARICHKLW